jgi:hypothetical protein
MSSSVQKAAVESRAFETMDTDLRVSPRASKSSGPLSGWRAWLAVMTRL